MGQRAEVDVDRAVGLADLPWLLLAETYVTPVGSVSAIDTPVASDGPLLLAVKV